MPPLVAVKHRLNMQRGPLDPGEFRVAGLDRAVGAVALVAGLQELAWRRVAGPADRQLGEARGDGLVVVEPGAVAPLAADPVVERLGPARERGDRGGGAEPGRVAVQALAEDLGAKRQSDGIAGVVRQGVDPLCLAPRSGSVRK